MHLKLGFSSKAIREHKWIQHAKEYGFGALEINHTSSVLRFIPEWLKKAKAALRGMELSMHSITSHVFTGNPYLTRAELEMLKAEITACSIIGAKELVFHLKEQRLRSSEAISLKRIISFAKRKGVEMLYESNARLSAGIALDFLKRFPDVNYNLDMGHLNYGYCSGTLGMEISEFIERVRGRVVYVHAHNNYGSKDEHRKLSEGTLDWKQVLGMLDASLLKKIIIEMRDMKDVLDSRKELEAYFRRRGRDLCRKK